MGTATKTYHYIGGVLYGEKTYDSAAGYDSLIYLYDESGSPYGYLFNNAAYYYEKNIQGDVIGIWNASGTKIASYTYDAWGNILSITDQNGNDVSDQPRHQANLNPIRYRGYYYDTELKLYWLNTRFYDPAVGRWISSEPSINSGKFDMGSGLVGYNLYSYCANNPVMNIDLTGLATVSLFVSANITALIGLSIGIGLSFDDKGNIAVQWSYSIPTAETLSVGTVDAGVGASLQYNTAETVDDLEGVSTAVGFSAGASAYGGVDIISNSKVSDPTADIDGVQVTSGYGVGVDVHVNQVKTNTIVKTTWGKIVGWFVDLFT